jgi:hypothetical protein
MPALRAKMQILFKLLLIDYFGAPRAFGPQTTRDPLGSGFRLFPWFIFSSFEYSHKCFLSSGYG